MVLERGILLLGQRSHDVVFSDSFRVGWAFLGIREHDLIVGPMGSVSNRPSGLMSMGHTTQDVPSDQEGPRGGMHYARTPVPSGFDIPARIFAECR